MYRIALMMLFGARAKYLALIFGLSFAVLLSTEQLAVFLGVLRRSTGLMQNIGGPDIWVVAEGSLHIDMLRGLPESDLDRVRSVPGVAWAEPMISQVAVIDLPDGGFYHVQLIGLDHGTLMGRPPEMMEGDLNDMRLPDSIIVEESGLKNLPGIKLGGEVRLNDCRARVVGICRAKTGLLSRPLIFSTINNARRYVPLARQPYQAIMVKAVDGTDIDALCAAINRMPNVDAMPADKLRERTMGFVVFRTAVGLNYAVTVALGLLVGLVVSTAAFNQFTADNLPHFAMLKAVGVRPRTLAGMMLLQAVVAGLIGYGIGVGMAALMCLPGQQPGAEMASYFPWELLVGALFPVLACIAAGSAMNLRKVISADPVVLFQ